MSRPALPAPLPPQSARLRAAAVAACLGAGLALPVVGAPSPSASLPLGRSPVDRTVTGGSSQPGPLGFQGPRAEDRATVPAAFVGLPEPGRTAGAQPVGSTSYDVPAGAVHVSPSGRDSGTGTAASPLRTLARAIAVAPTGATIVLRRGSYHETVTVPRGKRLTIQSYPREAVWLDGSTRVTGFVRSGTAWVRTGWTHEFDHSPTYIRGAPDSSTPGWQWLNPAHPMAAHPDQVWVNGVAQRQVPARTEVTRGTFYVDDAADRLYLGTDPTGTQVRASDLVTAVSVLGPDTVLRGIGVRRYAPSVPDMGTVRVLGGADDVTVENVVVADNATTGLSVAALRATLSGITSVRNGLLGIHTVYADGLRATGLRVEGNNSERFNAVPAAGGHKITRSRGVRIEDSVFRGNHGTGLWFDESCYDVAVTNSDLLGNARDGLIFELSARIVAANNDIRGNAATGLLVQNSNQAEIWNNTVAGSVLTVWMTQDARKYTDLSTPGHDPRQPQPDHSVTWELRDVRLGNNLLGNAVPGDNWCGVLCLQDQTRARTAAQMRVTLPGNVYSRRTATLPPQAVRWASGPGGMASYPALADFRKATGQEGAGGEVRGASAISAAGRFVAGSLTTPVGAPLPDAVAAAAGLPAGTRAIGPQRAP